MDSLVKIAIEKGAKIFMSVSGGKDGQAMVKSWKDNGFHIDGLIHADLGRIEWKESLPMCEKLAEEVGAPLFVVKRSDGRDMIDHWKNRMNQLKGSGLPFWSSSKSRYCTSDLKRDPINKFLTQASSDLIISCEGIRSEESKARSKKNVLEIRSRITSSFYKGMKVEEAIQNFTPGKRLALTYYPIFNYTLADVWSTYSMSQGLLDLMRMTYSLTGCVDSSWAFHPAYVKGNQRVSCMFCVLGSCNDLSVAAKEAPEILQELIKMEEDGDSTFRDGWSLKSLLNEPAAEVV